MGCHITYPICYSSLTGPHLALRLCDHDIFEVSGIWEYTLGGKKMGEGSCINGILRNLTLTSSLFLFSVLRANVNSLTVTIIDSSALHCYTNRSPCSTSAQLTPVIPRPPPPSYVPLNQAKSLSEKGPFLRRDTKDWEDKMKEKTTGRKRKNKKNLKPGKTQSPKRGINKKKVTSCTYSYS